jgi:hypothetical protein
MAVGVDATGIINFFIVQGYNDVTAFRAMNRGFVSVKFDLHAVENVRQKLG